MPAVLNVVTNGNGVTVICVPQWCVFPEHIILGMRVSRTCIPGIGVSPNVYP